MAVCRQCGKELPKVWSTDICLECSRENVKNIFEKDSELKQAFKESIKEMKKPESIKKMANDTVKFMSAIQSIKNRK